WMLDQGVNSFEELNQSDIDRFVEDVGYTWNIVTGLRKLFTWLGRSDLTIAIPRPRILEAPTFTVIGEGEVEALAQRLREERHSEMYPCATFLAYYAALTVSELVRLRWWDVRNGVVHVKRDVEAAIPLPEKAVASLEAWRRELVTRRGAAEPGYIFPGARGGHLSIPAAKKTIEQAARRLGMHITYTDIRLSGLLRLLSMVEHRSDLTRLTGLKPSRAKALAVALQEAAKHIEQS
ncbi:MAG: tyrosine-type recombinase/integrase, partial [Infirmifilum sp.]